MYMFVFDDAVSLLELFFRVDDDDVGVSSARVRPLKSSCFVRLQLLLHALHFIIVITYCRLKEFKVVGSLSLQS